MRRPNFYTLSTLIALSALVLVPVSSLPRPASATVAESLTITKVPKAPKVLNGDLNSFRHPARLAAPNLPHVLPGSYYSLRGNLRAALTLNNKGPEPLDVQPTLFNLNGERLDVPPVTVPGTSFRVIDLRDWAIPGTGFDEGSLTLLHYGMDMQLGAQVRMIDSERSLIFDEQLMQMMSMSSRLEAVWWLRSPRCNLRLVLSNTTDAPLEVSVSIDGIAPRQRTPLTVTLGAHQTRITNAQSFAENGQGTLKKTGGFSISYSGAPGGLLARGYIDEQTSGFSFPVEFSDPLMAHSSSLNGGGLRLGQVSGQELTPVVVVRNVGKTESIIRGGLPYTTNEGITNVLDFPEIRLAPGETENIDVARAIRQAGVDVRRVASAGLEFTYSGPPGSVLVSALSVSGDGNHVFRVPLVDAEAQPSSTGGYPWSINGNSSTFVYLTNVTDRPQQYVLQLNFEGGSTASRLQSPDGHQTFAPGLKTVQPHQTEVIDIRNLRDQQINDEHGRTIPSDRTRGQVHWSVVGAENLVLIGRAEQADLINGMATSYACVNCCPDNFDSGFTNPDSVAGFPGDTAQFSCMQQNRDCYGTLLEPFLVFPNWSVTNPNVASIDVNGFGTALNPGSTFINAAWIGDVWELIELEAGHHCRHDALNAFANAFCDVLAVRFLEARLVGGNRTAGFLINRADLSINTCNGDRFSIKATFDLPQYSDHCCDDPLTSFVSLSSDNKFEFAPNLIDGTIYDFFGNDSPPYAVVYLRRKANGSGTTSSVHIKVGGRYQNGESYTGQGTVHLTCE